MRQDVNCDNVSTAPAYAHHGPTPSLSPILSLPRVSPSQPTNLIRISERFYEDLRHANLILALLYLPSISEANRPRKLFVSPIIRIRCYTAHTPPTFTRFIDPEEVFWEPNYTYSLVFRLCVEIDQKDKRKKRTATSQ